MTSKPKEEILIPWTKNGIPWKCSKGVESISYYNFVNRVSVRDEKIVWKPNKPFDGAFQIIELVPGSDYCQLVLRNSENGQSFYIRDKDFIEAIKKTAIVYGVIIGKWEVKRTKGVYYGLKLVDT